MCTSWNLLAYLCKSVSPGSDSCALQVYRVRPELVAIIQAGKLSGWQTL